jgi:nucleoside triphosphate pyrophosphatase
VRLILASASPQRRDILASLGSAFEVVVPDVDERDRGLPSEVARGNALQKARAGFDALEATDGDELVVLGVDTVVAIDGEIWGKPSDADAAAASLRRLGGRRHEVVSGFALVDAAGERCHHAVTAVTFRPLDEATIAWYVASGEWRDRAGGYAIQGRGGALVERIDGDYLNVVGLPVAALIELWPQLIAADVEKP